MKFDIYIYIYIYIYIPTHQVNSESLSVKISDVQDIEQCSIICFSDAAFAILKERCLQ